MIPELIHNVPNIVGQKFIFKKEYSLFSEFEEWTVQAFDERKCLIHKVVEETSNAEIVVRKNETLSNEEYHIDVNEEKIHISAKNEIGVVWAFTSLVQLMDKRKQVSAGTIDDMPKYEHRGLALDCVRHFFSIDEVKKVIEEISLVKMNRLHWILSNDQGFRIESKVFPKLYSEMGGEYYTQEQIKEVIEFAGIRGVQIIPEIDMPGHTSAILAAYPELSCSGKKVKIPHEGGVYPVVLCPGKEETYDFVEKLIEEMATIFQGNLIHIGGDEAPDWEWMKCPCCQRKMKEEGFEDTRQLQGYFSERVKQMLAKRKKNVICWNDSLMASNFQWKPEVDGEFKQETKIQYWSVQYAKQSKEALNKGGSIIYSDMFELYLDYPSCMSSMEKIYLCKPEISGEFYSAPESSIDGLEACLWTENVHTDQLLEERLFPRIFAVAENTWSSKQNYEDFKERLSCYIEQVEMRGIHCQSIEEANPQGKERADGIKEYTEIMRNAMSPEMHELSVKFTQPGKEFQERFMNKFFGL